MCGIVGYLGKRAARPILLSGLKKLEYRGYDSAGLALMDDAGSEFRTRRSVGAVEMLERACADLGDREHQGIAHTRWATHGAPSEINAHPHRSGAVVLVHNGIIENHSELKSELKLLGIEFLSQTDTEVLAWTIETERLSLCRERRVEFLSLSMSEREALMLEALRRTCLRVEGHFSTVLMVAGLPNKIFGIQLGAPVAVWVSKEESVIASDVQALLPFGKDIAFIDVERIFVLEPGVLKTFKFREKIVEAPTQFRKVDWNAEESAKDGFSHFMLKEIHQQPLVVADTLSGRLPETPDAPFLWDAIESHGKFWKNAKRITLIGCGTAFHAALCAKYYLERWARITVDVDLASEFRYRHPVFEPGSVLGVISQSGETADTLSVLRMARAENIPTFAVCNVPSSTIAREADILYQTKAGPEIGVASTKAFTTQLAVLVALAQDIARLRGMPPQDAGLARLPHDLAAVLESKDSFLKIGEALESFQTIFFLGRGIMFPIALEGALKLKEISYRHAEGYAAGELKHGPIALVDRKLAAVVLAPTDDLMPKTLSNLEEIKARGGAIVGIGSKDNNRLREVSDFFVPMPQSTWALSPILYVVPLQLMSFGLAAKLGCSIDKPRNLAKSVTVE